MIEVSLENVIARQSALIAALDAGDVAAIETATGALSTALSTLRSDTAAAPDVHADRLGYALKQCDAARYRVNYLADRARSRLDRLATRRGVRSSLTYNCAGLLGSPD